MPVVNVDLERERKEHTAEKRARELLRQINENLEKQRKAHKARKPKE